MAKSRALVVSSFTVIKGSLVNETYDAFRTWDLSLSRTDNLRRIREENTIHVSSNHWARDVAKVIGRRFDPDGRDRNLVDLAKAGCELQIWKPLMLWHMTRDEFLVRDFLVTWLYVQFADGAYRLRTEDVLLYLKSLSRKKDIEWSGEWTDMTTARVAAGLLKIATDFGLLTGSQTREFAAYHLPDECFLYLLHVMSEEEPNARRVIHGDDWRMYFMDAKDVERELLRLHQFRKVSYQAAGSITELKLPFATSSEYVKDLSA